MKILGNCFGVEIRARGPGDDHAVLAFLVEDDGTWHEQMSISSFWFEEVFSVLSQVRDMLQKLKPDPSGYGKTLKGHKVEFR